MTTVAEPLTDEVTDLRHALARAQAASVVDRQARETYAARMNAAGQYVMTMQGLRPRQRRELLSLLYGNREQA